MATLSQRLHFTGARWLARFCSPLARAWPEYSRLLVARDYAGWTLDVEARALAGICRRLRVPVRSGAWMEACRRQSVFHVDQFVLMNPPDWREHRVAIAYYHGLPGSGFPEFDSVYRSLCRNHSRLDRVQVSHSQMRDVILESGIASDKVQVIPIGFERDWFVPPNVDERRRLRTRLGFPEDAMVVGSFQKDGVGWGEGLEPKPIKGPDVLVEAIKRVHETVPGLHVLLTGPARGYVKRELTAAGIPYKHVMLTAYRQIAALYHALDVYMVASRQEGGPKAALESMATGVPLVSTRVGQAMDLVVHTRNGFLVDVDDAEGLAFWATAALTDETVRKTAVTGGIQTAAAHSYQAQAALWRDFIGKLVAL